MKQLSWTATIFQLRILVGFLGERTQFAWWSTAFFEPSSRLFLEPVFVKTSTLAQYHGVVEAARRLHDDHLNVGSYHLFRLPEELEQDIHVLVQAASGEDFYLEAVQSKEAALQSLKRLAQDGASKSQGPIAVGKIKDLMSGDALKTIAGAYWSAFTQNTKTYPYMVS